MLFKTQHFFFLPSVGMRLRKKSRAELQSTSDSDMSYSEGGGWGQGWKAKKGGPDRKKII